MIVESALNVIEEKKKREREIFGCRFKDIISWKGEEKIPLHMALV